jgi:hypothetical protein
MTNWHHIKVGDKRVIRPTPGMHGLANQISLPLGQSPGSAWLLMRRTDVDALMDEKDEVHDITWTTEQGTNVFYSYYAVRAYCVDPDGDEKGAFLVEFRDKRQVLGMSVANKEYNVRIPVPKGSTAADRYFTDTLSGGTTAYTWQQVLDNLWTLLQADLRGTAPTLTYTPSHTPENLSFLGVNTWHGAIGPLVDFTQAALKLDATTGLMSLVDLCVAQPSLTSEQASHEDDLVMDFKPKEDFNAGTVPEKIRIFCTKRTKYSATSELILPPSRRWNHAPVYPHDRATSLTGAEVGTLLEFWTDMTAFYDGAGNIVNQTDLDTSNNAIGDKIKGRLGVAGERLRQIYRGLITTILPGSQVHEVIWRDHGGDEGLVTEIRAWPDRWGAPGPRLPLRLEPEAWEMWARATASITAGASANARIWVDVAGTMTDTGLDVLAYDRAQEIGGTLPDKTRLRLRWDYDVGRLTIVFATCEADTSAVAWGA